MMMTRQSLESAVSRQEMLADLATRFEVDMVQKRLLCFDKELRQFPVRPAPFLMKRLKVYNSLSWINLPRLGYCPVIESNGYWLSEGERADPLNVLLSPIRAWYENEVPILFSKSTSRSRHPKTGQFIHEFVNARMIKLNREGGKINVADAASGLDEPLPWEIINDPLNSKFFQDYLLWILALDEDPLSDATAQAKKDFIINHGSRASCNLKAKPYEGRGEWRAYNAEQSALRWLLGCAMNSLLTQRRNNVTETLERVLPTYGKNLSSSYVHQMKDGEDANVKTGDASSFTSSFINSHLAFFIAGCELLKNKATLELNQDLTLVIGKAIFSFRVSQLISAYLYLTILTPSVLDKQQHYFNGGQLGVSGNMATALVSYVSCGVDARHHHPYWTKDHQQIGGDDFKRVEIGSSYQLAVNDHSWESYSDEFIGNIRDRQTARVFKAVGCFPLNVRFCKKLLFLFSWREFGEWRFRIHSLARLPLLSDLIKERVGNDPFDRFYAFVSAIKDIFKPETFPYAEEFRDIYLRVYDQRFGIPTNQLRRKVWKNLPSELVHECHSYLITRNALVLLHSFAFEKAVTESALEFTWNHKIKLLVRRKILLTRLLQVNDQVVHVITVKQDRKLLKPYAPTWEPGEYIGSETEVDESIVSFVNELFNKFCF